MVSKTFSWYFCSFFWCRYLFSIFSCRFELTRVKVIKYKKFSIAVTKYLHLYDMTPSEIYKDVARTTTDNASSYATVKRLVNLVAERGWKVTPDQEDLQLQPLETTLSMLLGWGKIIDYYVCREIAEKMSISNEKADNILTKELCFSKAPARWVFWLKQRRTRRTLSTSNPELLKTDEENFLVCFIPMGESWFRHDQSKRWKHTSLNPRPRSFFQLIRSWHLFWVGIPNVSCWSITSKRVPQWRRYIIQNYPNASKKQSKKKTTQSSVEESLFVTTILQPTTHWLPWQQFVVVNTSLSPSTLFPSPNLFWFSSITKKKKVLDGRHFASGDDVIYAVEDSSLKEKMKMFYTSIKVLHHRWRKCLGLGGEVRVGSDERKINPQKSCFGAVWW